MPIIISLSPLHDYHKIYRLVSLMLAYSSNYAIIGVTETWLNDSITNNEIPPIDFVIYHKDRVLRGGGVMLAMHSSISSKPTSSHDTLDLIVIEIKQVSCSVCTVYIPPKSGLEYMLSLVYFLSTLFSSKYLIIMGHFNSPDINWAMPCGFVTLCLVMDLFNLLLMLLISKEYS